MQAQKQQVAFPSTGMAARRLPPSTTASSRWSPSEDAQLVEAIVAFGTVPAWKTVARYVPTRTEVQCRDRYNKVVKNAPHWQAALQYVVPNRLSNRNELQVAPVVEGVLPLRIQVPPPCEETTSAFSFESMHALGALPHLAQPVPFVMPSPDSMAQLPRCPTPQLPRCPTPQLPAPPTSTFVPRIVPVDACRKLQSASRLVVRVVPTLEADSLLHLPTTRWYVTTGRALQQVNDMIGASPKKRARLRAAAAEKPREKAVEGVVFNGRLVSAV